MEAETVNIVLADVLYNLNDGWHIWRNKNANQDFVKTLIAIDLITHYLFSTLEINFKYTTRENKNHLRSGHVSGPIH